MPPSNTAVAPEVTAVVPADEALNVPINTKIITAAFNVPMNPDTITATSFTLACPAGTAKTGTVSYLSAGNLATLTLPAVPDLPADTICTATITTAAKDLAGTPLASNFVWTFTTSLIADTTRPGVLLTIPATTTPGPTAGVPTNTTISAVFDEDMAPATIAGAGMTTFTVTGPGVTPVTGSVIYTASSRTALFTPSPALLPNTTYTATITTVATDLAGNQLAGNQAPPLPAASNYVWTFTTSAVADTTRPTVTAKVPLAGAINVPTNTKIVTATFSEAMNPDTLLTSSFKLACPAGSPVALTLVTYSAVGNIATLTIPAATNLPANTICTATVTSAAKDVAGNALAGVAASPTVANDHVWTFTTGIPPSTLTVTPLITSTNVCVNWTLSAAFSEAIQAGSITPAGKFTVQLGVSPAPLGPELAGATTAVDSTHATFKPTLDLLPNTFYTATIKGGATGIKDLSGDTMAANKVWTFQTGTNICQAIVPLGLAAPFAILASAAITNIPTSHITGNLGLTPDTGANITGFSSPLTCPEVTGIIYKVDAAGPACAQNDPTVITNAKTAALTAYGDATAAGRGTPASISGNLNGLTLYPGLYQSLSTIEISAAGHLYLDALGDTNAVFIIRSATSITTEATSEVHLLNGAKAANVLWTSGSAVTLGTSSIMKGTIIASTAITMLNLSNLDGRALNQGAAAAEIRCNSCTITVPTP
ncbi:MAG: Ig-like domain-containing protein [bacterium]